MLNGKIKKYNLLLPIVSLLILFGCPAFAWTVSPVRFDIKGEKGKEYTLTFAVLNESQLYQKRFEIQIDDWIIANNNEFLRKAFTKGVENKHSASSWIKVTPQQFVVPPGETKNIRFTISVPSNVEVDGDYTTGIFVGEKNIEKPPKGEKIVHIKQDTFIGVIVYVKIGKENYDVTLKSLKVESKAVGKGLNKISIFPVYENMGNVYSRGQILVKVEPTTPLEITETDSRDMPRQVSTTQVKEFNAGEVVVLRESEVTYPIDLPEPFPENSEWKITVKTDFGDYSPVLVGAKKYKVPLIKLPKQVEKKEKTQNNQ